MTQQLVLQFAGDDAGTLDKVVELEDKLIEALDSVAGAEVDGHETGDGVTYITLIVKNSARVWDRIESFVEDAASDDLELEVVAFRAEDGEDFTVLWPSDYEGEFEMS